MTTFTGEEVMRSGKSKENKHIHCGVFVFCIRFKSYACIVDSLGQRIL